MLLRRGSILLAYPRALRVVRYPVRDLFVVCHGQLVIFEEFPRCIPGAFGEIVRQLKRWLAILNINVENEIVVLAVVLLLLPGTLTCNNGSDL